MSHFDEKSGVITAETPWGKWWQTANSVWIEVNVPEGTRARDLTIDIQPKKALCKLKQEPIIDGEWFSTIKPDESTWTLEEKRQIHMQLTKADASVRETVWRSLLKEQYRPDVTVYHEMKKKIDLEKFQQENPAFSFRAGKLTKPYDKPKEDYPEQD